MRRKSVIGLFTELRPTGGVPQFGRHAAAALTTIAAERGDECRLFSLRDARGMHELAVGDARVRFRGYGGERLPFALGVLAAGLNASRVFMAHPYLASLAIPLRVARPNARVFIAAHGIDVWSPLSVARRAGLRAATGVMAVSAATARIVAEQQGVAPGRISVVFNALDPLIEAAAQRDGNAPARRSANLVLSVGRLAASERYKGIDTVLKALPLVLSSVPDTRYVVVGDGDDRPRLEELSRSLGVGDRVEFVGHVGVERLLRSYRDCAVFAMPSSGEGFGIVFVEAMAFGKPVVAANRGGAPEVVIDGKTGFLVEPDDVDTLAHRLVQLLSDEALRATQGAAARERVAACYTFDRFRTTLSDLLKADE